MIAFWQFAGMYRLIDDFLICEPEIGADMYWEDIKQQFRTRGKTNDLEVDDMQVLELDSEPEIVVLLFHYRRTRDTKPWAFRLRREDLPKLVRLIEERIAC